MVKTFRNDLVFEGVMEWEVVAIKIRGVTNRRVRAPNL